MTSEVLADDGMCKSTADVQLVSYVSDSNLSVLLKQTITLFNTVQCSWLDSWSNLHQWYLFCHFRNFPPTGTSSFV